MYVTLLLTRILHRRGEDLIDGVADTLRNLRELGKYVYFITNNSTKSRKACLKKFLSLGLDVSYEGKR